MLLKMTSEAQIEDLKENEDLLKEIVYNAVYGTLGTVF